MLKKKGREITAQHKTGNNLQFAILSDTTVFVKPVTSLSLGISETKYAAMLLGATSPFTIYLDASVTSPSCYYFLV